MQQAHFERHRPMEWRDKATSDWSDDESKPGGEREESAIEDEYDGLDPFYSSSRKREHKADKHLSCLNALVTQLNHVELAAPTAEPAKETCVTAMNDTRSLPQGQDQAPGLTSEQRQAHRGRQLLLTRIRRVYAYHLDITIEAYRKIPRPEDNETLSELAARYASMPQKGLQVNVPNRRPNGQFNANQVGLDHKAKNRKRRIRRENRERDVKKPISGADIYNATQESNSHENIDEHLAKLHELDVAEMRTSRKARKRAKMRDEYLDSMPALNKPEKTNFAQMPLIDFGTPVAPPPSPEMGAGSESAMFDFDAAFASRLEKEDAMEI